MGLFEGFNTAGGIGDAGVRQSLPGPSECSVHHGAPRLQGGRSRCALNRDTTYWGMSPNGEYDFGAGTAYAREAIPSASGNHNINPGDPLPDTLSSFLTGSPFVYTVSIAPSFMSSGAAHRPGRREPQQCYRLCRGHLEDDSAPDARLRVALGAVYAHQ